jgi:Skp family chaperone for outer membrane proteins
MIDRHRLIPTLLIAGALLAVARAQNAGGPTTTVVVCDMTALFSQLEMVRDLERKFGQQQQVLDGEAKGLQEAIINLQKELESGAFKPGTPDFESRQSALVQKQVEAEVWLRTQELSLRQSHKRWFLEVYDRAVAACREIAQSSGAQMVIADNPIEFDVKDVGALIAQIRQKKVVYADPRLDITQMARERLDAQYLREGGAAILKLAN